MKSLVLILSVLGLVACGSENPFERGGRLEIQNGSLIELPKPGETPVDQPAEGPQAFYERAVKPLVEKSCDKCHDGRSQYSEAKSLIVAGQPEQSELFNKASGMSHRKVWSKESQELAVMKKWIQLEN